LPAYCYGWIGLIILVYLFSAEMAKKWFYTKYDKK